MDQSLFTKGIQKTLHVVHYIVLVQYEYSDPFMVSDALVRANMLKVTVYVRGSGKSDTMPRKFAFHYICE